MSVSDINSILYTLERCFLAVYKLLQTSNNKSSNSMNSSGDKQHDLDIESNEIFFNILRTNSLVKFMSSEEYDNPVEINKNGLYNIVLDPLDGSGNINSNLSLGSIFAIFKDSSMKNGRDIICSGYCLYTYKCLMVYSTGRNNNFIKNLMTNKVENLMYPIESKYYCINEKFSNFNQTIKHIVESSIANKKTCRWSGCMVSDIHRIIISGGNFIYPEKKLRLLYECYPMSFLIENIGGKALDITNNNILDIPYPRDNIHMKTSIITMLDKDLILKSKI